MSFSVEAMLSERAKIGVSLMISLTVNVFKRVRAQFPLFYFKSRQVDFEICLATSCEIMVVFALMRTVTLDTLQSLSLARKGGISLFLAVFALRNT